VAKHRERDDDDYGFSGSTKLPPFPNQWKGTYPVGVFSEVDIHFPLGSLKLMQGRRTKKPLAR